MKQRRKLDNLTEPKAHHPVVPPQHQAEDIVDLDAQLPRGRHDDGVRARLPRHARRDALRCTEIQLVWRHDCDCQCHEFADMQPSTRQITGSCLRHIIILYGILCHKSASWQLTPRACTRKHNGRSQQKLQALNDSHSVNDQSCTTA